MPVNKRFTGRQHTLKSRAQMSASHAGVKLSTRHRLAISAGKMGHSVSPEARAKMAVATAKQIARGGRSGKYLTPLALDLAAFLLKAGYGLVPEVRFGRYVVDFYEPDRHLAFEADSDYWHGLTERAHPGHYARRDMRLLAEHGLPVVRFTEAEIKELAA